MTQAGAKGPAAPAKPPAAPAAAPAKGGTPAAPGVTPKAPAAAAQAQAVTPKATAPIAPKKGPPPLPPESGPEVGARAVEPMRPRLETAPGMGHGAVEDTPRGPPVLSREEIQSMVKAAVAGGVVDAISEAQRLVRGLERRIEELEKRPVAVAPAPPVAVAPAQAQYTQPAARTQALAPAQASLIPVLHAQPQGATLDVKQIERDVHVEIDTALDGGRRKRRLVILVVLFVLIVFGGLFAMLAQSYAPHG